MNKSTINFEVFLDDEKIPNEITWNASDSPISGKQNAKAIALSIWDANANETLKMDLWTKEMTVEEMNHFVVQSTHLLLGSLERATGKNKSIDDMREALSDFGKELGVVK